MARILIWLDNNSGNYRAVNLDTQESAEYPPLDEGATSLGDTVIPTPAGIWIWDSTRRWMNIEGTWQWVDPTYNLYYAKWVAVDHQYVFAHVGTYEVADAPYWAYERALPDGSIILGGRLRVYPPESGKSTVVYIPESGRDMDYPVPYTGDDLMFSGGRLLD